MKFVKRLILIGLMALIPTFAVWLPYFARLKNFWTIPLPEAGMATIVANYDGPLYLVVAKTFYNQNLIKDNFQFPLSTEYYAAHFPLFPALIKIFSYILGFPYAMLAVTVGSTVLCLYFFNKLAREYLDEKEALFLTFAFSIFPARFLIVRSIGSPEPLFLAGIIASVFYFAKKKYWLAGIWGAVAAATKSPGILLFIAYFLYLAIPKFKDLKNKLETLPILLIPASLFVVFLIYKFTFNNFFAYFRSGDNIHLFFPPFQIFNFSSPWVGTFWLEEIIFVYLIGALGVLQLIKQKEYLFAWFAGIFFATTIFVSHRDLIRYSLPMIPFLYIAFREILIKKEFKIALVFLLIPIYLFSLAFISQNVMPIANWGPFL